MHATDGASLPRKARRLRSLAGALGHRIEARRGRARIGAPGAVDFAREWRPLAAIVAVFLLAYYLPVGQARFNDALVESLELTKWYAREHVILCLVPAFFIAGAVAVFMNQASVIRFLGARANKLLAYSVGAISGTVLAVCSCTVLPLFAGIYKRGAGLGPAPPPGHPGPAADRRRRHAPARARRRPCP